MRKTAKTKVSVWIKRIAILLTCTLLVSLAYLSKELAIILGLTVSVVGLVNSVYTTDKNLKECN